MKNDNQILIKNKSGQLKTVDLNVKEDLKEEKETKKLRNDPPSPSLPAGKAGLRWAGKLREDENKKDLDKKLEPAFASTLKDTATADKQEQKNSGLLRKDEIIPSFYFHREDEEEALKLKDKEEIKKHKKSQTVFEYLIDDIIKQSNLNLLESVNKRLRRVIDSRLRDVRDLLETKDVLIRPVELGGVGLINEQAQKVLKIIESVRIKTQEGLDIVEKELLSQKQNIDENILQQVKPFSTYIHPSYQDQGESDQLSVSSDQEEKKKKIIKQQEDSRFNLEPTKKIPGQVFATSQEIIKPKINLKSKIQSSNFVKDNKLEKDTYQEFKINKRLVGPVEELSDISINDFRKLGTSISDTISKIKNKIELLQDESYEKKAQGIKAWRSSPVYQNYLNLGNKSIEQEKSVEEIIKNKTENNEQCLTLEEFNMISDLSQQIFA